MKGRYAYMGGARGGCTGVILSCVFVGGQAIDLASLQCEGRGRGA